MAELLAFLDVLERRLERAARHADHLRPDTDATGVERLDRNPVALAYLTYDVRRRYLAAVQNELAGARRADTELVFFLADREALEAPLHREGGDPLVAL